MKMCYTASLTGTLVALFREICCAQWLNKKQVKLVSCFCLLFSPALQFCSQRLWFVSSFLKCICYLTHITFCMYCVPFCLFKWSCCNNWISPIGGGGSIKHILPYNANTCNKRQNKSNASNKQYSAVLTLTPKSTDVELQMAPMLAAANMASTAWMPLGR